MRPFEYAHPETEAEAIELLNEYPGETALLAGGTDLVGLQRAGLLGPRRLVDLKTVPSLKGIIESNGGVLIGAATTLAEMAVHPLLERHRALLHVIDGVRSIQIQSMGTLGGDLCHLPNCWFYRNGEGLLGLKKGRSLVEAGDNRYHAILGNSGPAKFVSASRFAPPAIAWGAQVRVVGPGPEDEEFLPLENFFITPRTERQGVTVLGPGQFVSHVWLPAAGATSSASYEVLELEGLDWPLAAASCCLEMDGPFVRAASIVLGHVAPIPWVARQAADSLAGRPLTEEAARQAGEIALAGATPLKHNQYKVRIAQSCVRRALLRAAGQM